MEVGWAAAIGALGAAIGGVLTAIGAVIVSLYKARGANAKQSDEVAIGVYRELVVGLNNRVGELEKELRSVLASEAECRKAQAEMAVEIRWLQDSVRMLQQGTFPKQLHGDTEAKTTG